MFFTSTIAFTCFTTFNLIGQEQHDFDRLMIKRQADCSEVSYNCGMEFIRLLEENKSDSVKLLLRYWEDKCGMREPVYRAKILLALLQNEYDDSLLTEGSLNNIFNYQNRMDIIKNSTHYTYDNYKSYFGYIPPGQEFDRFTQDLAKSLKKRFNPETKEYALADFYGENSEKIFEKIQNSTFGESVLAKEYESAVKKFAKMPELHFSWITGVWIPTGKLSKLGVHPDIGYQAGIKHKKMNYDLTMTFKFLNSPNEYYARRVSTGTSPELTNHFFGGHIGFDVGRDMYYRNGHELQLTAGIAFDGFDALREDKENNLESESTSSYNFSAGVGYRFYITNSFYLGVRAKYNFVDYSLNNVIDFTGNPVTVQFIIGTVNNVFRNDNLRALKYRLRR